MTGIIYNLKIITAIIIDLNEVINLLANCSMTCSIRDTELLDIVMVNIFKNFSKCLNFPFHWQLWILRLP